VSASPTGLEIEAAYNAVNVDTFVRKVEIWDDVALHCSEIDLLSANTTRCHKLGRNFFFMPFASVQGASAASAVI